MIHASNLPRTELRKRLRQIRRNLSKNQQLVASQQLSLVLFKHSALYRAKKVAIYLPNDGEIDTSIFAEKARKRGIKCFLPALHPVRTGALWFADYQAVRKTNRFGIKEPDPDYVNMNCARALDVVFMPLVGFDKAGSRLGMGGGFYDRTFAFKNAFPDAKPKLIGLAHDCQEVDKLPSASWDISMEAIVTNKRIIQIIE